MRLPPEALGPAVSAFSLVRARCGGLDSPPARRTFWRFAEFVHTRKQSVDDNA